VWKPRNPLWIKKNSSTDAGHDGDCDGDDDSECAGGGPVYDR
jgi:hypothetical protein